MKLLVPAVAVVLLVACVPLPARPPTPDPLDATLAQVRQATLCDHQGAESREVKPREAVDAAGFIPVSPNVLLPDTDPKFSLFSAPCNHPAKFTLHYKPNYPNQGAYSITIQETLNLPPFDRMPLWMPDPYISSTIDGIDILYGYSYHPAPFPEQFPEQVEAEFNAVWKQRGLSYFVSVRWFNKGGWLNRGEASTILITEEERTKATLEIVRSIIRAANRS